MFQKITSDWKYAVGIVAASLSVVLVLLAVFLVVKTSFTLSPVSFPQFRNSISVAGTGEVDIKPEDIVATFEVTIQEGSESVESAQELATKKTNDIINYLKDQGVEEKDLKTLYYNIYPKYSYTNYPCDPVSGICPDNASKIIGYEISQSLQIKVRDTKKAGDLIAGVGAKGVSYVGSLNFSADPDKDYLNQAKVKAIEDAKEKAKVLAAAMGVKIVKVSSYYDSGPYPMMDGGYGMGAGEFGPMMKVSPELPQGQNKATANVTVNFEIQ